MISPSCIFDFFHSFFNEARQQQYRPPAWSRNGVERDAHEYPLRSATAELRSTVEKFFFDRPKKNLTGNLSFLIARIAGLQVSPVWLVERFR